MPLAPLRPCNLLKTFASYLLAVQCKYNQSIYCVLCCFISKVCGRTARGDEIQRGYNFWHNTARADTPRLVEAEQEANSMCISALQKNKYSLIPHSLTVLNLLHPIFPVSLNEAVIFCKKLKGKLAVLARCSDDFSPVGCAVELERQRLFDNAVIDF